jgi:hypothetical protein
MQSLQKFLLEYLAKMSIACNDYGNIANTTELFQQLW